MSQEGINADQSGLGFAALLTILFMALKLLGKIQWSWLWILSPIWISFLVGLVIVVAMIVWNILTDRE